MTAKMHPDELDISTDMVARLLAKQFPEWSKLSLKRVVSSATNNALFKLGNDMAVRLPRIPNAVKHIETERTWLPKLAPNLPVAVPQPLGLGKPDEIYPWPWTIYTWLDGTSPKAGQIAGAEQLAKDLAAFIVALHAIDTTGAPQARRGRPLTTQDADARQAIKALEGTIDGKAAMAVWDQCLQAPAWGKEPVWVHGDLMPANLLVGGGHLSGICDFEDTGIGDPACDLIPGWNLLPASARATFRAAIQADDATWQRGKGWAFSMALMQLPYYEDTNPAMAENARYVIAEVLSEAASGR